MDLQDSDTHSFVVKIWAEEAEEETGLAPWRGHITHAFTGERRYLKKLGDILAFITPYLVGMDVKMSLFWRVRQWLKRGKH